MTIGYHHFTMVLPQCFSVTALSQHEEYCLSDHLTISVHSQTTGYTHSSRLNHKRWKSIETQDDLKCELIMNSTLYAGAGGNHVWGIESWIYFSLKDIKHKAEVVNPLPHWRRVKSAHQKSFRGAGGHIFCVQPRSLGSVSMYLCVILIDITLY